jgi:hypothetical protein
MESYLNISTYPDAMQHLSALADQYHLRASQTQHISYCLLGSDFAILLFLSRDGVDLRFVDLPEAGKHYCYALAHYLFRHRRKKELVYPGNPGDLPPSVTIPIALSFCIELLAASPDILSGDRTWLQTYDFDRMETPKIWLNDLHELTASKLI